MQLKDLNAPKKINYTGIFFEDGTHMTWSFGFPLQYPQNVISGDEAEVTVVGKYEDSEVSCWIVTFKENTVQPKVNKNGKKTLLHITTKVSGNAKPVDSGLRATEYGYTKISPFKLKGVWR